MIFRFYVSIIWLGELGKNQTNDYIFKFKSGFGFKPLTVRLQSYEKVKD